MGEKTINRFSIGEFAKLCNTTRATLYHYEKQGLLVPIVNEQNGYRFYELYDYYIFMYIAHLIRIGFSLNEIREYVSYKRLDTYMESLATSRQRLENQQEQLRLRNERTQRGLRSLNRSLGHPLNLPQITYHDAEHFLRMPYNGDPNGKDCICCQSKLRRYAEKNNIDIQGHYLGFFSDISSPISAPFFGDILLKMNEKHECDYLFSRPAGLYISLYYRGPFAKNSEKAYRVLEKYMEDHHFTPLTGMFVEDVVGPFISSDSNEYLSEMSVMIE